MHKVSSSSKRWLLTCLSLWLISTGCTKTTTQIKKPQPLILEKASPAVVKDVAQRLRIPRVSLQKALGELGFSGKVCTALRHVGLTKRFMMLQRNRALQALRHCKKPLATYTLKEVLNNPKTHTSLYRNALQELNKHNKKEALPFAFQSLKHKDVTVREVAIDIIASHPGDVSKQKLLAHQSKESSGFLKKRIKAILSKWK